LEEKLKQFFKLLLVMAIFPLLSLISFAQQQETYIDNYNVTGAKKGLNDTLGNLQVKELAKQTVGLLEKEINPEEYVLGPNDMLAVSFLASKTKQLNCTISPDGRLMIPEVGVVNLKGKTLAQADGIIKEAVGKVFKAQDVFIVLTKLREFKVTVSGAVMKPATVSATAADRVSEIIERAGGFKNNASVRRIRILRDLGQTTLPVDILRFYMIGEKKSNPTVLGGDHIIVPPSSIEQSLQIMGEVPSPGTFEFVDGDSLSTLFKFAHGFVNSSNLDSVEIARFVEGTTGIKRWFINIEDWRTQFYTVSKLNGDIPLKVGDRVYVRQKSDWLDTRDVIIAGEVNFPGKYAINRTDMRVRDIIERAGGVTDEGALESAMLKRRKEIEKEDLEMSRLYRIPYSEMSENEKRYFQARVSEQRGVMSINFKRIMDNPNDPDNILVIDEDSIYVPQKRIFVNVQGRVNNPGLVIYKPGYTYMDYVLLAGGFGFRADEDETLIVKKKGEQFLAKDMKYVIEPGDNILVPPKSETTFFDIFSKTLTISTQILAIVGVLLAVTK
jgi:protein involved in polysaccharide export with SLBB domain